MAKNRAQLGSRIGKTALLLLALTAVLIALLFVPFPARISVDSRPAADYDEAMARLAQIATIEAEQALYPGCETQALTHGAASERAIVLFHGYRGCPLQFLALGERLHGMGYNVLLPRMPQMGYAAIPNDAQGALTADEVIDAAGEALDIAHGLGDEVTVAGLSAGGLLAAWSVANRDDVDRAVLISPFFEPNILPDWLARPAANLFRVVPNVFMWQDSELREGVPNPPNVYPRNGTRPLSQLMLIGFQVRADARRHSPLADSIVVVTNGADGAVDPDAIAALVASWRAEGYGEITEFAFDPALQLDHDLVDPAHPRQQVELVYPILLDLITGESIAQ